MTPSPERARTEGPHVPTAALVLHVLFSLLTHLAELTLSALLAFALYHDVTRRDVFFSLASGLTILPLVTLQLLSAIFLLRSHGDSMTGREAVARAGTHVLQLGFVWRHLALILGLGLGHRPRSPDAAATVRLRFYSGDLQELRLLRLVFALTGGFPLLLLQLYLILSGAELTWTWLLPVSLSVCAASCVWTLVSLSGESGQGGGGGGRGISSSSSSSSPPSSLWAGAVLRVLWRAGEMVSRMTPLALFGCLYGQWVVGVLGGHWVVMVICVALLLHLHHPSSPAKDPSPSSSSSSSCAGRRVLSGLLTSYSFVWCFVTVSDVRTALWYVVYYVIVLMENGALCVLWLMETEEDSFVSRYLPVVISALGFAVSMVCLTVHHKHFVSDASSPHGTKAPPLQGAHNQGFLDCESRYECRSCQNQAADSRQNLLYCTAGLARCGAAAGEKYTGVHRPWLDSASSDCLSIATASTGHLPRHTAGLDRGFGTCGEGVCVGRCQGYMSPPSCVSAPGCVDMVLHSTRSSSPSTLVLNSTHRLGEDARSSDTVVDLVPSWMVAEDAGLKSAITTSTLPYQHARHTAEPELKTTHSQQLLFQQRSASYPHYYSRCMTTTSEQSRLDSDGYSTDHTVMEWSRLPLTPLAANVWRISDTDTDHGYTCYLSPGGGSKVSSVTAAAAATATSAVPVASSRSIYHVVESCEECRCHSDDVVYGIPRWLVHPRRKGASENASSPEVQTMRCSSCLGEQQMDSARVHSPASVFSISSRNRRCCCCCCGGGGGGSDTGGGYYMNARAAHSDGSAREVYGVVKKSRQLDRRKRPYHRHLARSLGRHDQLSVCSSTPSSLEVGSALSATQSYSNTGRPGDKEKDGHTPSKLQVRALVEKSDEDVTAKARTSTSLPVTSEPIYENVLVLSQYSLCDVTMPNTTTSGTADDLAQTINTKTSTADESGLTSDAHGHYEYIYTPKYHDKQRARLAHAKHLTHKDHHQIDNKLNCETKNTTSCTPAEGEGSKVRSSRSNGFPRHWTCVVGGPKDMAGHVCSESEDSALPAETFSSSVEEGFMGTDLDSENNEELII